MSLFDLGPHESVEFNRYLLRVRKEICRLVVLHFHVVSLKFGGIWSDLCQPIEADMRAVTILSL